MYKVFLKLQGVLLKKSKNTFAQNQSANQMELRHTRKAGLSAVTKSGSLQK
jgi:hypothetical protein